MPPQMPPTTTPPYVPPINDPTPTSSQASGVSVSVGSITNPALLPNVSAMIDPPTGMLLGYGQSIDYTIDYGLVPMLVAGPPGTAVEFTADNAGSASKIITAISLAVGMMPPVPSSDTGSNNDVLLSQRVSSFSPGRTLSGAKCFGVIVQYVYGLQLMPGPQDNLDMGSTPIDSDPPAVNGLQPSQWLNYLTAPASPVTGAGNLSAAPANLS